MSCVFGNGNIGTPCRACGYKLLRDYETPPRRSCGVDAVPSAMEMGDAIEEFLTSYGITKEWYIGFKKEHGLSPNCNCDARQEWLNKTANAHPRVANVGLKLLNALKRSSL